MSTETTPQTTTEETQPKRRHVVSTRVIILGLLLIPLNCYWMAIMEVQWNSLDTTCVSLFFHVIFLLLVLTGLNALVKRRFPEHALTQAELMVVYVMLSIASAIMGRDSLENLPPVLGYLFWFNDPSNGFTRFWSYVPKWMAPHNRDALKGYYIGNSSFFAPENFQAWLIPLLFWICFVLVLTFMMLCLNVLVRKQWTERERLTYPIVQIPMTVTGSDPGFFRNKLMWIGFAIPMIIQSVNSLGYFYPNVPTMHLKLQNVGQYFVGQPWNGVGWLPIGFFPFAIGIAFFLPLDLSFSCWFFYILRKLIDVGCVSLGFRDPGVPPSLARIPYVAEQGTGAWIGLSIALIWLSRKHFASVFRTAFGRGGEEDPDAGMTYRSAVVGVGLGLMVLVFMCGVMGMSLWLPFIYFGFYFILSVGITRVRAELGPPAHELNWVNPERFMVQIFGTQAIGAQNLTLLSYMFWFNRGYRSHPMPHQLEAMKIGKESHMEPKRLLVAILLATVVGTVASLWALMTIFYKNGEATGHIMSYSTGIGREAFNRLQGWVDNPQRTDWTALAYSGVGAGATLLLALAKSRLVWWPFHPIGYALANSYALEYFWSAILCGWFIKFWVVRYGGVKGYRMALPFFMGLILGDYVVASIWSLIGWALGISTYRTFIF